MAITYRDDLNGKHILSNTGVETAVFLSLIQYK